MTQTVAAQTAADAPDLVRASDMSLAVAERLLAGVKAQA